MSDLPPPPSTAEIDLPWLLNNKSTVAAYMAAIYALSRLQIVVTTASTGARQPATSVKLAQGGAILEITV